MHWSDIVRKHRKERQNASAFAGAIASPVSGEFTMPAGARIRVGAVGAAAAGVDICTSGSRTFKSPGLDAGGIHPIGYFHAGTKLTPLSGFDLLVDTGLGRYVKIGEGA